MYFYENIRVWYEQLRMQTATSTSLGCVALLQFKHKVQVCQGKFPLCFPSNKRIRNDKWTRRWETDIAKPLMSPHEENTIALAISITNFWGKVLFCTFYTWGNQSSKRVSASGEEEWELVAWLSSICPFGSSLSCWWPFLCRLSSCALWVQLGCDNGRQHQRTRSRRKSVGILFPPTPPTA